MKQVITSILLLCVFFVCLASEIAHAESCDVEKVIGAQVSQGTYRINVKRESSNLYKVTGQEIYIKTKYCYEYAYSQDAILEVTSPSSSYSIGELHFLQ